MSFFFIYTVNPLLSPLPLSNKPPPLLNKPHLFRGGKLISTPSRLSPPPPPPPPPILTLNKKINDQRGLISYDLFRLEVRIVFGLRPHDLQLHVLNFFNFAL